MELNFENVVGTIALLAFPIAISIYAIYLKFKPNKGIFYAD